MRKVLTLAAALAALAAPVLAQDATPDALSVEWKGQHPCEKLYEDAQIRVARCTFPPGAVHLRHSHPAYLSYVLEGGRMKSVSASGAQTFESVAGKLSATDPIPWHEATNVGDTTVRYLIIEKKYAPK